MASKLTDLQVERFERLAWPFLPMLLRAAQCMTHRDDQAEDLVQETMIKAMRAIDRFEEGSDMKAWLLTIQRRTFIDLYRSRKHRRAERSLDDDKVPEPTDDGGHDAEGFDRRWEQPEQLLNRFDDDQIIDALRSLPDEIRWTLLLVDVEQMDQQQAAEVLDVPVGTIKSRAHRGRGMLRNKLYELARQRGWVEPKPADDNEE
ncbi:MAG: sigma-70 family RNA polymerase sigma factor [Planctomycetes bacterium]|nr:sigma-70 family RNA polymerase sigma factor [Planctomycetota bacterium]